MMKNKDETVTLDCELLNETPKAYKIEVLVGKKRKQCWIAKSVSKLDTVKKKKGDVIIAQATVPSWLAEKEELV